MKLFLKLIFFIIILNWLLTTFVKNQTKTQKKIVILIPDFWYVYFDCIFNGKSIIKCLDESHFYVDSKKKWEKNRFFSFLQHS